MASQPPPQQPTTTGGSGLDTKLASTLCYALWWLTGIVFLVIDKDNPEVRFHAWQSIAFFGGITVLRIGLGIIGGLAGTAVGVIFGLLNLLISLGAVIVWIVIMIQTYQGKRVVLPIAGPFAEQQAAKG